MFYGPEHFYNSTPTNPVAGLTTKPRHYDAASAIFTLEEYTRPPFEGPLNRIMRAVSLCLGVAVNDLKSPRRTPSFVLARFVFYKIARDTTQASLPQIGSMCGGRDHSTVLHGLAMVELNPAKYAAAIRQVMMFLRDDERMKNLL